MTVQENIKKRRKELGITLLEMANYIGVKEATAQRYESGEIKTIPYDNIVKISEMLHCYPQELMGWVKEDEKSTPPTEDDVLNARIIELFGQLTPENKKEALSYLDYKLNSQGKK